ncbi:unnamed protein product, partial [Iphiclides podalirius]
MYQKSDSNAMATRVVSTYVQGNLSRPVLVSLCQIQNFSFSGPPISAKKNGTFSINDIDVSTQKIYISTNTYKSNTEASFEPVTYLNELGTNYDETKNESDSNKSNLGLTVKKVDRTRLWVYAAITSLILITLLLIIIVTKRKSITRWLKGGSYVVQDGGGLTEISLPIQAVDMSYQSIMEKKNHEHKSPKHS